MGDVVIYNETKTHLIARVSHNDFNRFGERVGSWWTTGRPPLLFVELVSEFDKPLKPYGRRDGIFHDLLRDVVKGERKEGGHSAFVSAGGYEKLFANSRQNTAAETRDVQFLFNDELFIIVHEPGEGTIDGRSRKIPDFSLLRSGERK